jgi:hypothetical protein
MKELSPWVAFGLGLLVLGWVMLRIIARQGQRRFERSPTKQLLDVKRDFDRRASRGDRALRDAPPETLRWQVEMHETARELQGQLESKIALLAATVRLAEEKIQELKTLIGQVEEMSADQGAPSPNPDPTSPS